MESIKSRICGIIAQSGNGVIGKANRLPWSIKEDLHNFRKLTEGGIVVMGRKTYESLPVKKLKNRVNIILTREQKESEIEGVYFCSVEGCVKKCKELEHSEKRIFIIGGEEIYGEFLDVYTTIYITKIEGEIEGDRYSPFSSAYLERYEKVEESEEKRTGNYSYRFLRYERE